MLLYLASRRLAYASIFCLGAANLVFYIRCPVGWPMLIGSSSAHELDVQTELPHPDPIDEIDHELEIELAVNKSESESSFEDDSPTRSRQTDPNPKVPLGGPVRGSHQVTTRTLNLKVPFGGPVRGSYQVTTRLFSKNIFRNKVLFGGPRTRVILGYNTNT